MVLGNIVVGATLSTSSESEEVLEHRLLAVAPDVRAALEASQRPEDQAARIEDLRLQAEYWLDESRPPTAPDRQCLHWPLEFPEIFVDRARPGFDAVVGNPPFQGGKRISGPYGTAYREHLVKAIADGRTGNADLVTYFFLRAAQLVRKAGSIALLATNTIAQGDTREVGLDWLTTNGWSIARAVKSRPWPGDATLEIARVWLYRGEWSGMVTLEDRPVGKITSSLDSVSRARGPANRLAASTRRAFIGSLLNGIGFVLDVQEASSLINADQSNADVIDPYLIGEDLNSRPDCTPARRVINFADWPLEQAEQYPDCLAIVRERVKPRRDDLPDYKRRVRDAWWRFEHIAPALYAAISNMARVLVIARVSKTVQPAFVPTGTVFSEQLVVFTYDDDAHFGLLASAFHYWWAITRASTMRTDLRYTPTDCFETFPQPVLTDAVDLAGGKLDRHRRHLMLDRSAGLTSVYNLVHSEQEQASDVTELRRLHINLDYVVAAAYGWEDLPLGHGFWETPQGMRFTISPEARIELLDRLLELNHARYAEEVGSDLRSGKNRSTGERRATYQPPSSSPAMFEVEP
jgi:hypothetical protein